MKVLRALVGLVLCASASTVFAYGVNLEAQSKASDDKMCLDVRGGAGKAGVPIILWRCHGKENQRWALTDDENGQSAFIGVGGLCMDVRQASTKDGASVELWKCHFGPNQRYTVTPDGMIKEAQTGKCIIPKELKDLAPVVLGECTDPKAKWHFAK